MDNLREDEIKNSILHNQAVFSQHHNLGRTLIIYEKTIYHNVIADCLIFSNKQGIIGVEIKTQHDNLKRLSHQLDSYVRTCTYTYVYCHDSKVAKVQHLLKQKHYDCVGIISYEEFDQQALVGLVKEASLSPYLKYQGFTSILWNSELTKLVYLSTHERFKSYRTNRFLAQKINNLFSNMQASQIIAEMYIEHETDPRKPLQRYHFNDTYIHDKTFLGGR